MKIQEDSIFNEDCLEVTKKIENDLVDLIYIDPPFFTQNVMSSSDKRFSFNDKWDTIDDYLNYLKPRILDFKRILKNTGCIFVHCDRNASAYIKCMLDDVFGLDNFQSEIIWTYKRWSNSKKGLLNAHQTIFFYSKTKEFKFNKLFSNYSTTTNLDQILQARKRDENGKSVYLKDENGKIVNASKKAGVPLSDVWEIPFLNPKAKERVNYPTQKPIELLERIIKLTTDEGDLVFDGFMGSGTTLVAAKLLNRHYIGCDISYDAYTLSIQRLNCPIKTESILLKSGYKAYDTKPDYVKTYLELLGGKLVQRNKYIDGFINSDDSLFVPVKILQDDEDLDTVLDGLAKATTKRNLKRAILIGNSEGKKLIGKIEILMIKDLRKLHR